MNHCTICGNNIADEVTTCHQAGYGNCTPTNHRDMAKEAHELGYPYDKISPLIWELCVHKTSNLIEANEMYKTIMKTILNI